MVANMCCNRTSYCNVNVSNVQVTATNVIINITLNGSLYNLRRIRLHIARCINLGNKPLKVVIVVNGGSQIPVLTANGNTLYSDQLRVGREYCLVYGNDPVHFSVLNGVCRTAHIPTVVPADINKNIK